MALHSHPRPQHLINMVCGIFETSHGPTMIWLLQIIFVFADHAPTYIKVHMCYILISCSIYTFLRQRLPQSVHTVYFLKADDPTSVPGSILSEDRESLSHTKQYTFEI